MPYDKIMRLLRHKTFFRDIRKYNSAMAFASMRCNLDHTLANAKKGVFTFRISGQVMHKIGPVFPTNNKAPGFSQIYFYDPEMQATIRNNVFKNKLSKSRLKELEAWISTLNPFSGIYKTMREHETIDPSDNLTFFIRGDITHSSGNKRQYQYDRPTSTEIAVLFPGSGDACDRSRDIILETFEADPNRPYTRIWETHPSYDPLYYVLMHPAGEHGWTYKVYLKNSFKHNPLNNSYPNTNNISYDAPIHADIALTTVEAITNSSTYTNDIIRTRANRNQQQHDDDIDDILESYNLPTAQNDDPRLPSEHGKEKSSRFVSCREFYAYRLQMRPYNILDRRCYLPMFGRLFQQYIVDQYAKVEAERLRW
jgi:hypothetical protein